MNNLLALIDGLGKDLGQGGVIAIASIALVFAILAIIIVISFFKDIVILLALIIIKITSL
mgnify:CR=1 FL=1